MKHLKTYKLFEKHHRVKLSSPIKFNDELKNGNIILSNNIIDQLSKNNIDSYYIDGKWIKFDKFMSSILKLFNK
jgi:hypothetical protein